MKDILIIDDNEEYLDMLTMLLSKDYKVHAVSSYEQLEHLSDAIRIQAILLDFHIGPFDAYDVLELLKQKYPTKQIPIVLTTGSTDVQKEAARLGLQHYLEKPVSNKDIRRLLSELVSEQ